MRTWLIAPLVLLAAIAIGGVLRYRRQRRLDSPVSDQWIADHVDDATRARWWK